MALPPKLTVSEFIDLCDEKELIWKWAKVLLYCEACKGGQARPIVMGQCPHCKGKGMKILEMPVTIIQKLPPDDFEFLKLSIRLGDQYG